MKRIGYVWLSRRLGVLWDMVVLSLSWKVMPPTRVTILVQEPAGVLVWVYSQPHMAKKKAPRTRLGVVLVAVSLRARALAPYNVAGVITVRD
jgi:hypothetical protein